MSICILMRLLRQQPDSRILFKNMDLLFGKKKRFLYKSVLSDIALR